ncbi:DUF3781 domain-containing protein [Enterococcus alishanensis]
MKTKILSSLCYTELVYQRINKKLQLQLTPPEIETFIYQTIAKPDSIIEKKGKNFYISNPALKVRVTVNSHNYRVITADKLL